MASLSALLRTAGFGTAARLAANLEARFAALEAGSSGLQLADAAPANVSKSAAAIGDGTKAARNNHKHDIDTAAAVGLTSASTSAEGGGTTLARAAHTHEITGLDGRSTATLAEKSAGALAGADFGIPQVLILDVPAGASGNVDFTTTPFKFRVLDVFAQKVTTSADAGDSGQLQTGAGAAITSALALNVAGDALARTTSITAANAIIAAAGTLRWARTQATNAACKVYVTVVRVP